MLKKIFKKPVRFVADRLINSNSNVSAIDELKLKVNFLNTLTMFQLPESLPFSDDQKAVFTDFKKKHGVKELNTAISKNDFMFMFELFHRHDIPNAIDAYLDRGLRAYNMIDKIIKKSGFDQQKMRLLDFACGHGCVLRFLTTEMPAGNIYASDIKKDILQYVAREFDVPTIPSVWNPSDFKVKERFELIFVSSLFTHLPEELFTQWLTQLFSLLTPNGVLFFSTHNITRLKGKETEHFAYIKGSEDTLLNDLSEAITNTNYYGTTYNSDSHLIQLFGKMGLKDNNYALYGTIYGSQDLVAVSPADISNLKGIF